MVRRSFHFVSVTLACAGALCALMNVPIAHAAGSCDVQSVPAGTRVNVTGGIAGLPGRLEQPLAPGQRTAITSRFHNRTGRDLAMTFESRDIGSSPTDPDDFIRVMHDAPFGARSWITLGCTDAVLKHGEMAVVDAEVLAPIDAEPGSYYAAVMGIVGDPVGTTDVSGATLSAAIAVQVFINVPGTRVLAGEIFRTSAPRVVLRSRSERYAGIRASYRNTGNVTDVVAGKVQVNSMFGNRVTVLPMKPGVVLRGGSREFRALWADTPWIGRFTPRVELTREDGTIVRKTLPSIWVAPSYPYLFALVGAIAIPLAWRWRDRRRTRAWAAHSEAQSEDDVDPMWDEDVDADSDVFDSES